MGLLGSSVRLGFCRGLMDAGSPLKNPHDCHSEETERLKNLKNARSFAPLQDDKRVILKNSQHSYSWPMQILPPGDYMQFSNRTVLGRAIDPYGVQEEITPALPWFLQQHCL
jgi:hypothetical protein